MWIRMHIEGDFLTARYKIALDELICCNNKSINQSAKLIWKSVRTIVMKCYKNEY